MPQEMDPSYQPSVEKLTRISDTVIEDFVRLLPQLTGSPTTREQVDSSLGFALDSQDTAVMVVRDQSGRIQATATGSICRIPTGEKPWVDDVVTDVDHRGQGMSRMLMESLHAWFLENGVTTSNLTSKPERMEAGNLYEKLGYVERDTRVYRAKLGGVALDAPE